MKVEIDMLKCLDKIRNGKILNKIFLKYTKNKYLILFRYLVTGGIVTLINILLLYIFVEIFKISYILSNIISTSICITITYIISKKIIFTEKVKIGVKKEFLSYIIISIISIIIDTIILNILIENFSTYYIISKILSTCVSTITNYFLKKKIYDIYKY